MRTALTAGFVYFAIVFFAGFVLGTLRVFLLVPSLGEVGALSIELPVMLVVSWVACGKSIERFSVPSRLTSRSIMGGSAFALLMAAETALSVLGFGRTLGEHFESYRTTTAVIGLVGQIAFALFPIIQLRDRTG